MEVFTVTFNYITTNCPCSLARNIFLGCQAFPYITAFSLFCPHMIVQQVIPKLAFSAVGVDQSTGIIKLLIAIITPSP
jgi:hypothetical protein